ncbi:MAG: efflux RND transporter periplasmic adaptor subunit [Gammaproteobacteria bacterium]|nr:efflux RND transporter periplasmic adaptor subunit [Gammaproteobacteria bacterium]
MKLYRVGSTALACLLLLSACQQGEQGEEQNVEEEKEETAAVPVETAAPVRGDIYATYSGTAPIEAYAEADVIAKVEGEVRQLLAEEGDSVGENQVLAKLDGDRLRLELNESRARLQKLQRDFERNDELRSKGLISEGDYEKLQYDLQALQASYNLASLELDYTQIRAPIKGVVSERYIKLGNTIKVGDPVFRVTSLDPLVAYMFIPEREFRRIAAGQPVHISVDALDGPPVIASVTRVSPIVDPETGTFKITVEIRDNDGRIKPGMFGRMNIVYDKHENVLQVPRSAISELAGESSIFVVENDIGIRRTVTTGYGDSGMIEITSGLSDDEQVITIGHIGLKNEASVIVINAAEEAADDSEDTTDDAEEAAE